MSDDEAKQTAGSEPEITVNGVALSFAQAMTMRVALQSFLFSLEEGLGEDEHGRKMSANYAAHAHAIERLMARGLGGC